MTSDTPSLRRKPPARGNLTAELRTLLTAAGLPCAEPEAERERAVGFQITAEPEGSAVLEWFVSQSARATAASEQTMGIPYGHAIVLHGEARRHLHSAAYGLLETLGYTCGWTTSLTVRVGPERRQDPTTLAGDVQRIVAEWGRHRQLAHTLEARTRHDDAEAEASDQDP